MTFHVDHLLADDPHECQVLFGYYSKMAVYCAFVVTINRFSHDVAHIVTVLTLSLPDTTFVVCSSHLLMFLSSLYCKQYGPRSDQGS